MLSDVLYKLVVVSSLRFTSSFTTLPGWWLINFTVAFSTKQNVDIFGIKIYKAYVFQRNVMHNMGRIDFVTDPIRAEDKGLMFTVI